MKGRISAATDRQFVEDRSAASISAAPSAAAQRIVVGEQPLDLGRQRVGVGEIDHADGAAADLVLIGRADAAPGGADLGVRCCGLLAHAVELAVQRTG